MERTETTAAEQSERKQRSPELVRPVEGRMLAGVGRGIADNFGISEWIPRVLFIVTTFMGGLGLALYAAGWVFIRSEDEPDSIADRFFSGAGTSRSWMGIGLMVIAGIIILSNVTFLTGEVVWAGAFLVVGLLLYLGYIPTGASRDTGPDQSAEPKEGVQRMTATDTLEENAMQTPSGDSPAGGAAPPPPAPSQTPPDLPPAEPRERSILGRLTIGAMLIGMGILAVLDNIQSVPIAADPRHYLALSVTILGVGLMVGSMAGRARWLILLAVILVPTLVFSPVFEYDWTTERFDVAVEPTAFEELEPAYSIDAGSLVIDLTGLDWNGEVVELTATGDIGFIQIRVPENVAIEGNASVDVGRVAGPTGQSAGLGDPSIGFSSTGEDGLVDLNLELDIGNIEVVNR